MSDQDAEISALLAAATLPAPPTRVKIVTKKDLVQQFLRANEIEPGAAISIEVCALYQLYLSWGTKLDGESKVASPRTFSVAIVARGFKRKRPHKARAGSQRDRRCLMVKGGTVAARLIAWVNENPLTDEHRTLFNPARRWTKQ